MDYWMFLPFKLKKLIAVILIIFICNFTFLLITRKKSIFNENVKQQQSERIKTYVHNNYSIFYLESIYNRKVFTTKEMCAIESAARVNPTAIIRVYTFKANFTNKTIELLRIYPNIRIIKFEPEFLFKGTPFLQWWLNGDVFKSPYAYAHISDAFR